MYIGIHYSVHFDNRYLCYIHTIQYNFNGRDRRVIINEDNDCEYSNAHIKDIVFNDMEKMMKIYRK